MKKLIITFLVLALFLTGCSTPAPAADNTPSNNNPNNESIENPGDNENTENNKNPAPTEKTPATQITNEGQPQDENDDFLFVFKGKEGYFARGKSMLLGVELINNTGAIHTYEYASSYRATIKLFCITNGEEYVLSHEPNPSIDDGPGSYYDIDAGDGIEEFYYYNIPADAPAGEYTLVCQYQTTKTEFKDYFTLK